MACAGLPASAQARTLDNPIINENGCIGNVALTYDDLWTVGGAGHIHCPAWMAPARPQALLWIERSGASVAISGGPLLPHPTLGLSVDPPRIATFGYLENTYRVCLLVARGTDGFQISKKCTRSMKLSTTRQVIWN